MKHRKSLFPGSSAKPKLEHHLNSINKVENKALMGRRLTLF